MESSSQPYLSLVLTGRNDNYGGDFRSRLQHCITNAFQQLSAAEIASEIIFVNYNPTDENEPIERFINWPKSTAMVSLRIITVPDYIHQQLVADGTRKNVPVLEYMGKNAGIRRATGEFILSMNPDIILTEDVVKELKQLRKDSYYRADRIDFNGNLNGEHELKRVFLKGHDFPITTLDELAGLRFRNYRENAWKCFTPQISGLLNRFSKPVYYEHTANRYHCNVSGDFMLMHRSRWMQLHAHHEHTVLALHVDSLMVVQAASSGLKEKVLKNPIFHQEHERRYDATQENPQYKRAYDHFEQQSKIMLNNQAAEIYNDNQWGLSNFELPELKL